MKTPVVHWRFHLPSIQGEGWAIIFMDSQGSFSALSDWGDVGYRWPDESDTRDFREFILGTDDHYLIRKFAGARREYDESTTLREVKRAIISRRRDDASDGAKVRARGEWDLLEEYDNLETEGDFRRWYEYTRLDDASQHFCQQPPDDVTSFVKHVMPRLRKLLEKELQGLTNASNAAYDSIVTK